jgi:FeS assembly SUF system regulator
MRKTTDYGFVVLAYLASDPVLGVHTARAVSEGIGVPQPTVAKVLKQLGRAGIVVSTRGLCGGYMLARGAHEISVVDVIEALEGPLALTECSVPGSVLACDDRATCDTGSYWPDINRAVVDALRHVTLSTLAGDPVAKAS